MARRAAALFLLYALFSSTPPASASTPPTLDSTRLTSATGASQAILHVTDIGRYSVSAQSATGASFEIVDRMAGRVASASPSAGVSGSTGRRSRVDVYLEPGEYLLRVTHSPAETVTLEARAFDTTNAAGGTAPVLADGQSDRGDMGDLQLRQYWVTVDPAHPWLRLEAWGRSLQDLAVWKDGSWDTGLRPQSSTRELEAGKPLTVLELNARPEPGTYLVTCAGGARAAWAKESGQQPFWITRGARFLGEMGRMSATIPAQGTTSFLVSGTVGVVEMQVRNAQVYRLLVNGAGEGQGRYAGARQAGIDQKSTSFRCRVSGRTGAESSWVTVEGPPGETVDLTWLTPSDGGVLRPFTESGTYLAGVISSMEGDNSVDATGLIIQANHQRGKDPLETKALQAVELSADKPLRRQVNCLGELSFILQPQRGTYAVVEKDRTAATASYAFQLLDDALLSAGTGPQQVSGGGRVTLTDKLYLVTISPVKAGILDFAIVPTNLVGGARTGGVFAAPAPAPLPDIGWPSASVIQNSSSATYLILPPRRDVTLGLVVRKLPADLSQPLPVRVGPGGTVTIPVTLPRDAMLASTIAGVSAASFSVDGAPWSADGVYTAGTHTLAIRNAAPVSQWHVISAVEPAAPEQAPPPQATGASAVQALPALTEGAPAWRGFDRQQTASWLLTVPSPGSYRLRTRGRLAMGLAVRTPLRGAFAQAAENVDGRNAEVISYLRQGSYLVQATSRGATTGRAGLVLERLPVVAAGAVRDGDVLRATVPQGQVLQADVLVETAGDYALECLGLGRAFPWRLEDAAGWPIGDPVRQGTMAERMNAGTYHYLSLAMREQARRVLWFRAADHAVALDPNARRLPLTLNQPVQKTWNESDGRAPDVFTLSLPAEVQASLSLSAGMRFRLVDSGGTVPYQGIGGKALAVSLHAGDWRLEVTSLLEDNQKRYDVALSTLDLLPGTPQPVSASPQDLPVSVGAAGTVEIWSYGGAELDASLTDESGRLVASGQTIADDWNFRVLAQVAPGRYVLHVSSPLALAAAPAPAPRASRPAPRVQPAQPSGDEEGAAAESGDQESAPGDEDSGTAQPDEGDASDNGAAYADDSESGGDTEEPAAPAPAVVPAQSIGGVSVVRLVVRQEQALPAASGSVDTVVDLGQEIAVVPFTSAGRGVYRLGGASTTAASAAVYRDGRLLAAGPTPLRIPLAESSRYTLRFWTSSSTRASVRIRADLEGSTDASAAGSLDVATTALRIAFPAGTSYQLESDAAGLWYSPGPDQPFQPLEEAAVSSASAGWAVRADGAPIGACRLSLLTLADGRTDAALVGSAEASFQVTVPGRSVALVRTENPGRAVGLSAGAASVPVSAAGFDWNGARTDARGSALGLRDGTFRGRLWDTAAGGDDRRIRVSMRVLPVESESALGKARELTVSGNAAAVLTLAAGQPAVEVSLDRGMVAFGWNNAPAGLVDAATDPVTGTLSPAGGSVVIMNLRSTTGLCTAREAPAIIAPQVSESSGWETGRAAGDLSLEVSAGRSASRLYVFGAAGSALLYSRDDGKIYAGQEAATDLGTVQWFPAQRGRLVLQDASGPVRAWIASPDQVLAAFVARDSRARQAALAPEGGALQPSAQAWALTLDTDAAVLLRADGDGVLAAFNAAGTCVDAAASPGSRSLVTMLPRGTSTIYTRPFADSGSAAGMVSARVLTPRTLDAEGEGPQALVGARDAVLYRFTVAERGRVGCGIRTLGDTVSASLLDARFNALATGRLFLRTLERGTYYLLVQAGEQAQRVAPVVYGLRGNAARIPDDVMSSFQGE